MKAMPATAAAGKAAALLFLFMALLAGAGPAQARKVALVIGNDRYQQLPVLERAVSDADAISATLRDDLKFDVVLTGFNLTRTQSVTKFGEFESQLRPGDTAFFFFSGHGVAPRDRNLLLPVDFPREATQDTAEDLSQAVDSLLARLRDKRVVGIFVLDACRDNPLPNVFKSAGYERGLAPVNAPQGTFVLLSAGAGQRALDRLRGEDNDRNSVFTRKLLPLLRTPGLSLSSLAKRVQIDVADLAQTQDHEQFPEYRDSIRGDIYMLPDNGTAARVELPGVTAKSADEERPVPETLPTADGSVTLDTPSADNTVKSGETVAALSGSNDSLIDEDVERLSTETAKNAAACDAFTIAAEKLANMKDFGDFDPYRLRKDVALDSCGALLKAMPDSATAQAQMALALYAARRNIEALPLFQKSAAQGIVLSMLATGKMYVAADDIPFDTGTSFSWLSKAAEAGSSEGAQLAQGVALMGDSVDFLQRRANVGDGYAMYVMARQYAEGRIIARDEKTAALWLVFAVRKGSKAARASLTEDSPSPWPKAVIAEAQKRLTFTGDYNGDADGTLNFRFQRAIKAITPKT
ncbi:caspase family protein [Sinorhizobium sp. RAC02]|uniref:caspase family protein n=1 Tax=Sinorhizobium sp. RAC02 TaxID=1842534 RepID=UPI00083DA48A|nr:caspase family protein [Sinorhizobium sp. RAC02]AOF89032.1 caspase domain protein [Sinorhizobium sp. RAC02]